MAGKKTKKRKDPPSDATPPVNKDFTLSIAVSGTVIENTQNLEHATWVAGQIARSAAIFNAQEVVVVDESGSPEGQIGKGAAILARILQFMETPQYLRKSLIPVHPDLACAGLLPPLDAPHHQRATEWGSYREGVVLRSDREEGSFINVGLDKEAHTSEQLVVGMRVTLAMGPEAKYSSDGDTYECKVCVPSTPWQDGGLYWGYTVRVAHGLQAVFDQCPCPSGYDLTLGTSERGTSTPPHKLQFPPCKHLLVAFGGPEGLEACAAADGAVEGGGKVASQFDMYINTCPAQGSRTIRTEEAILISMSFIQSALAASKEKWEVA